MSTRMVTREQVLATINALLAKLDNKEFEERFSSRENWEQERAKVLGCLDCLAEWHGNISSPHCGISNCNHMLSLVSVLGETNTWHGNRLVFLWYLTHVTSTDRRKQQEAELAHILEDVTEEDISKINELRGGNQEYPSRNLCARLMFVAPLVCPDKVKEVLESHPIGAVV